METKEEITILSKFNNQSLTPIELWDKIDKNNLVVDYNDLIAQMDSYHIRRILIVDTKRLDDEKDNTNKHEEQYTFGNTKITNNTPAKITEKGLAYLYRIKIIDQGEGERKEKEKLKEVRDIEVAELQKFHLQKMIQFQRWIVVAAVVTSVFYLIELLKFLIHLVCV